MRARSFGAIRRRPKKSPSGATPEGQSLINDQNPRVRAERDDNDDDHHESEARDRASFDRKDS